MGMTIITTQVMLERQKCKITPLDCVLPDYKTMQSAVWLQIFQRNMLPARMLLQNTRIYWNIYGIITQKAITNIFTAMTTSDIKQHYNVPACNTSGVHFLAWAKWK